MTALLAQANVALTLYLVPGIAPEEERIESGGL
jgi:hypothetical protein